MRHDLMSELMKQAQGYLGAGEGALHIFKPMCFCVKIQINSLNFQRIMSWLFRKESLLPIKMLTLNTDFGSHGRILAKKPSMQQK